MDMPNQIPTANDSDDAETPLTTVTFTTRATRSRRLPPMMCSFTAETPTSTWLFPMRDLTKKNQLIPMPQPALPKALHPLTALTFVVPNVLEGGSKHLSGREVMDLWDWICVNLQTRSVCLSGIGDRMKAMQEDVRRDILRLRLVRCHKDLKLGKPMSDLSHLSWQKAWHLYCEFGTKGVIVELRRHGGYCFKGSSAQDSVTFNWNDLLRAPSLSLEKEDEEVKIVTSITPPIHAPYLLKCVPDRVTDDSGAMISDVILRMNQYRPQEGRQLSRTVLDHAGRECFVIRVRVGEGFWRRGGKIPSAVKREDRIVEIREGSWSYVAGSIGRCPVKVVGTAIPKEPVEQWKAAWEFSTGDELMIGGFPSSVSDLSFCLKHQAAESTVKLLKGRRMQYQLRKKASVTKDKECQIHEEGEDEEEEDAEEGVLTLVRFTENDLIGKATALLNRKLMAVEFLPEEDAVFVLLLCICILKSVSEMKKDVGGLLIRRLKEEKFGTKDWGSVVLHPTSSSSNSSPHIEPWYKGGGCC